MYLYVLQTETETETDGTSRRGPSDVEITH